MDKPLFCAKPYETLYSYQRSLVVYRATVFFCKNFVSSHDRTYDQMIQAARSGKQNIVEGAIASATSKTTEIHLTNVARASLEELREDYRDFLSTRGFSIWNKDSAQAVYVRNLCRKPNPTYENVYQKLIESRPAEVVANIVLCLISQTEYLLRKQIDALEKSFLEQGGIREQMTRARIEARSQESQSKKSGDKH